jgi:hypothetical protein
MELNMRVDSDIDLPRLVLREPDLIEPLLELVQSLISRYPAGARTVLTTLVAEGRRFAATGEGQRWRSALPSSELFMRGRLLWYVGGFDQLVAEPDESSSVPSDWLALVAEALARTDLEALLSRRVREGDNNEITNDLA